MKRRDFHIKVHKVVAYIENFIKETIALNFQRLEVAINWATIIKVLNGIFGICFQKPIQPSMSRDLSFSVD